MSEVNTSDALGALRARIEALRRPDVSADSIVAVARSFYNLALDDVLAVVADTGREEKP